MNANAEEKSPPAATVGCGTYLLLALVVFAAVRAAVSDVESEVRSLRGEVRALRAKIERLSIAAPGAGEREPGGAEEGGEKK